jgi:hypothetical protein
LTTTTIEEQAANLARLAVADLRQHGWTTFTIGHAPEDPKCLMGALNIAEAGTNRYPEYVRGDRSRFSPERQLVHNTLADVLGLSDGSVWTLCAWNNVEAGSGEAVIEALENVADRLTTQDA